MQNQLFYKICFIFNTLLSVQIKVKTKLFSTYQIENYRANAVRLGFFLIKQANNVPPIFFFHWTFKKNFLNQKINIIRYVYTDILRCYFLQSRNFLIQQNFIMSIIKCKKHIIHDGASLKYFFYNHFVILCLYQTDKIQYKVQKNMKCNNSSFTFITGYNFF